MAMNAIMTAIIAYRLWCVAVNSLDSVGYHEVILQESLHIDHEDSRLEWTKESSADHIDSSCRIRPFSFSGSRSVTL